MQSWSPLVWSFRNVGCYCAAGTLGAISRRAIVAPVRAGILSIVFRLRRCQQTSGKQILHRLSGSPILSSGSLNGPREHGHRRFHIGKVEGATRFAGLLHGRLYSLSWVGCTAYRASARTVHENNSGEMCDQARSQTTQARITPSTSQPQS